ncbi:MAG TPA: MFS transporter [Steroidobacteraceae bacterium]
MVRNHPESLSPPAGDVAVALIVACAMFMAQLDGAVVVLAMPSMGASFHVSAVAVTAGITSYLMVQVAVIPASGWIADRWGARRVFAASIVLFALTSVLCAACTSVAQFTAARALQGAAAAIMTPVSRIVLLRATPRHLLLRANTISSTSMLLAPTLGPALGGLITQYASWRWIFLLNVPMAVIGAAAVVKFIPLTVAGRIKPFDFRGYGLFALATTPILYATVLLGGDPLKWALPVALLAAGLLIGVLTLRHLRTHPHPLIPLDVVAIASYRISTITGGALVRLPIRAMSFILPLMFQLAMGYSAVGAGLMLLALNGGDLVFKGLVARILAAAGYRKVLIITTALMSVALFACMGLSARTSFAVAAGLLVFGGMCRSVLFSGLSTLAFADVPTEQLSAASVLWNIVQQASNGLGVSIASILLAVGQWSSSGSASQVPALWEFRLTLAVMALIALASIVSFRELRPDAGTSLRAPAANRAVPDADG